MAVIIGLIVGSLVNLGIIEFNTAVLFPAPPDSDLSDPVQFQAYLDTLPALAFFMVMLAHLGQAFVGGLLAARLAPDRPMRIAIVIGALTLAGGIAAMLQFTAPPWFKVELLLYIPAAYAAGSLERRRRASNAADAASS